jgi:hypothetical protein
MSDNHALATAALRRLLNASPDLLGDRAYMRDFTRGYIACCEAVDVGGDLVAPVDSSDAFVAGFEEALKDLGLVE